MPQLGHKVKSRSETGYTHQEQPIVGKHGLGTTKILETGGVYASKGKKRLKSGCRKETVKLEIPDMVKSSK